MRTVFLVLALFALAACAGSQPYSKRDLSQVHQAYGEIVPIYLSFKQAYMSNDTPGVLRAFHREQQACRLVDVVDKRDTIDPNVQLFQASAALDNLCNDIEGIYVVWAKKHRYPYDKGIQPAFVEDAFKDGDLNVKKLPKYLKHPSDLLA